MLPWPRLMRCATCSLALLATPAFAQSTDAAARLSELERGLAAQPRDASLRFERAVALAELHRDDDAMAALRALIEDHPELPETYNNLAVLQARRGDTDAARISLEAAVRSQPGHALAQENLGDLYAALAARAWSRALEADPSRRGAAAKLALIRTLPGSANIAPSTTTGPARR